MLRELGARVTVIALEDACSSEDRKLLSPSPLVTSKVTGPAFFGYSPGLFDRLIETDADILHLHGIWMYPSRAATRWARATGRPYLISPHGMLDPWITSRGRWKKHLARRFYERASWRQADAFHALTPGEAADIKREAGSIPVLVIPNAGPPTASGEPHGRAPVAAYLGRIHPKKNIGALVEAWAMANLPGSAELLIAGWGSAKDIAVLEAQIAAANGTVRFLGPVFGEDKQRLLEQARFLILPSHSEGLPMVILEAWAAGTPTIMTAACHLPEGFALGAAIECGTDAGSIATALDEAMARPEAAWRGMSDAARALSRERFSMAEVSRAWVSAYRGLMRKDAT